MGERSEMRIVRRGEGSLLYTKCSAIGPVLERMPGSRG